MTEFNVPSSRLSLPAQGCFYAPPSAWLEWLSARTAQHLTVISSPHGSTAHPVVTFALAKLRQSVFLTCSITKSDQGFSVPPKGLVLGQANTILTRQF